MRRSAAATGPIPTHRRWGQGFGPAAGLLPGAVALVLTACALRQDPVQAVDALLSKGKPVRALALTERALTTEPAGTRRYWELALRKAQALEKLNRRVDASAWLHTLSLPTAAAPDLATLLLRERAGIERDSGKSAEADRDLSQALEIALRTGQKQMAANLQVREAAVLIKLRRPEEAEERLSEAEQYSRESSDHRLDPYIWHYRGEALLMSNRFEDAIAPLERSLQAFSRAGNSTFAARLLISKASSYYRLGQIDYAFSLYKQALQLSSPADRHLALGHLGNISLEQRDYAQAARYYQQAAAEAKGKDQDYYARWERNLAQALIEQKQWAEAARVNHEALELTRQIDDTPDSALAIVNQGRIEASKGQYDSAEQSLRQVAESRRQDPGFALLAYGAIADLYVRMGKPGAVIPQFEAALALADETTGKVREDENKLSYLSSLIDLHRKYVDFLVDRGDQAGAFAVAESSRARLLRERLDVPSSNLRSHSIASYRAAASAAGATFLTYWIGPERSYLWAISGTQFASYPLPAEPEIRRLVERYQRAVERDPSARAEDAGAGTKLFQLLVPSAVRKTGGRYLIVPDGPLYALNFETLPASSDRPHFWVEDATVAVAPSLDMLLQRQVGPRRGRSLLLIGDAAEWNPEYPKLLHARQEMEGIEKLFAATEQKVLAGAEATPAVYKRSRPDDYTYIHFSAHATANKNSPFDSAIILSKGESGGKLSVKEVLATRVRADLVTISACHSAGARTYWGEGLVGFAWAFLQSGSRGVIAGLWDVSDYSSPRLMQNLYAGLAASQKPADALRNAKLELIRGGKYADPFYWGAFQLYEGSL